MLHFDLTGNAAVTPNAISCEVEERLRLMLILADPNIIFDLLTNNRFKGTNFNTFWDETEAYFNEQVRFYICVLCLFFYHWFLEYSLYDLSSFFKAKLGYNEAIWKMF